MNQRNRLTAMATVMAVVSGMTQAVTTTLAPPTKRERRIMRGLPESVPYSTPKMSDRPPVGWRRVQARARYRKLQAVRRKNKNR